jgi:hypothetical protein
MGRLSDERYRALAREQYHCDGEIEVDDAAVVSNGDDTGAYVAAWVWVDDPEGEEGEEDEDGAGD